MKVSKIILTLAASALLLSCSVEQGVLEKPITEKPTTETELGDISLSLNLLRPDIISNRSLDTESQKDKYAPVLSLDIFFINANGYIIYHDKVAKEAINSNQNGTPILKKDYPSLSRSTAFVYVVANNSTDLSAVTILSNLKKTPYLFADQNSVENAGKVVLQGEGTVTPIGDSDKLHKANVVLTPIMSRIEVSGIKTKTNNYIKSFKVQKIYLDKFYNRMDLNFTGLSFISNANLDGSSTHAQLNSIKPAPFIDLIDMSSANNRISFPNNSILAYNFFPAKDNTMPAILIRIENIEYHNAGNKENTGWLTIKKYKKDNILFTKAERGEVYMLGDIAFDVENISTNPFAPNIAIETEITVKPWVGVGVTPEL